MRTRLLELDALRGIAALVVVFFHYTMGRSQAELGYNLGCIGVDMFFIISGFVIFMSIEQTNNWKVFLWHRFIRLYPVYWFCVSLTTIAIFFTNYFVFKENTNDVLSLSFLLRYVANLTMFQYYMGISNIDGPYWTLNIELFFYILIAFILVKRKVKLIEKIGSVLVLFCSLYCFKSIYNNDFFRFILKLFPIIRFFSLFFAGILIYKMKYDKITVFRLLLYLLTLVVQCLLFENCYPNNHYFGINEYIIVLIAVYGLFLLFLYDKLSFIVNSITLKIGKISYSLYLIHQFIGISILIPGFMKFLNLHFWYASFFSLSITLLLSYFITIYIEQPLVKKYRNLSKVILLENDFKIS
ncbi:acyltransferase family protein [Flavobacterium sp. MAHUQ-51]|uniref:acyltransferase family protein n=1 Tax=Flavobacterium sp. GCM10022190 TaxID=3252639 RepID=UPI0036113F7C